MTEEILQIAGYLNQQNGDREPELSVQMLKLMEEVGEVAAAWIGYTGQNPRKGVIHGLDDVLDELADVAITAMVSIARLGADPEEVVAGKLRRVLERYGVSP
jgi:NTP pyrophosphatase (non-canonical NTP hydrolase)